MKAAPGSAKKTVVKMPIANRKIPIVGRITALAIKPKIKPIALPKPQIQATEEQAEEVPTTPSSVELVSVGSNVTQFIEDRVTIKKEAAKTVNKDNKKTALCDG